MGHPLGYKHVFDCALLAKRDREIPFSLFFREKIVELFVESNSCLRHDGPSWAVLPVAYIVLKMLSDMLNRLKEE
jgi:hypothetical protein